MASAMGQKPQLARAVHAQMVFNEPQVACTATAGKIFKKEWDGVKRR